MAVYAIRCGTDGPVKLGHAGNDDAGMCMALMGGAFCSGTLLLGTLVERAVVRA